MKYLHKIEYIQISFKKLFRRNKIIFNTHFVNIVVSKELVKLTAKVRQTTWNHGRSKVLTQGDPAVSAHLDSYRMAVNISA